MKRLADLNVQWVGVLRPGPQSGEGIIFDCPACGPKHRLAVYFSNPRDEGPANSWNAHWSQHGAPESLTVDPSIDYPCFHGWIEYGQVFGIDESPLVVPGAAMGLPHVPVVALSPDQAEKLAHDVIERVSALRRGA